MMLNASKAAAAVAGVLASGRMNAYLPADLDGFSAFDHWNENAVAAVLGLVSLYAHWIAFVELGLGYELHWWPA